MSEEEKIKNRPKVQKMIEEGKFNPPPGNTAKSSAMVLPFSGAAQNILPQAASAIEPRAPRGDYLSAPVGMGIDHSDKRPASVIHSPDKVFVQPGTGTKQGSQTLEFETPPGIGSPKGGQ